MFFCAKEKRVTKSHSTIMFPWLVSWHCTSDRVTAIILVIITSEGLFVQPMNTLSTLHDMLSQYSHFLVVITAKTLHWWHFYKSDSTMLDADTAVIRFVGTHNSCCHIYKVSIQRCHIRDSFQEISSHNLLESSNADASLKSNGRTSPSTRLVRSEGKWVKEQQIEEEKMKHVIASWDVNNAIRRNFHNWDRMPHASIWLGRILPFASLKAVRSHAIPETFAYKLSS